MRARLAALLLLALTGCKGLQIHAVVKDRAQPLADAVVSMNCPQAIKASFPSPLGKTDAQGEYHLDEPMLGRWLHDSCELLVEKPGFQPGHFPVASVCKDYDANRCVRAELTAELVPAH